MRSGKRVRLFLAVLLLAVARRLPAEGTGALNGTVFDPLGARVGGASIKLRLGGAIVQEKSADPRGDFSFDGLAEGRYQLEVSAGGFQTRTTDRCSWAPGAASPWTSRCRSVPSSKACR
jgi:hypothetical protein